MATKKEKTDKARVAQEDTTNYAPIYLVLNGNNLVVNNYLMRIAIEEANEYGVPLYITSNAGAPKDPPPCLPNQPNCHG